MPVTPPYLPFSRFLESLDSVALSMPPRLDHGAWRAKSPYTASVLTSAYRFLHLTDAEGRPTKLFQRLATDPASRSETMRDILRGAYGDVLTMIMSAGTEADVEHAFERFRLRGATYRKALSFLVQACRYADLRLPDMLTGKTRVSHAKTVRRPIEGATEMASISVTLRSGGEITLNGRFNPFALSAEDRRFVFKLIDELHAYEGKPGDVREVPWPGDDEDIFGSA
jgi:hypothetical protein